MSYSTVSYITIEPAGDYFVPSIFNLFIIDIFQFRPTSINIENLLYGEYDTTIFNLC